MVAAYQSPLPQPKQRNQVKPPLQRWLPVRDLRAEVGSVSRLLCGAMAKRTVQMVLTKDQIA